MATIPHIELRPMKRTSDAELFEFTPVQRGICMAAQIFHGIQFTLDATDQNLEFSASKRSHLSIIQLARFLYPDSDHLSDHKLFFTVVDTLKYTDRGYRVT